MNSYLYHLQINIDFKNLDFYKDLMNFLGWNIIFEAESIIGFKSKTNGDLWFSDATINEESNYDKKGVNHISIRCDNKSDIDQVVHFLETKATKPLFETPRHREELSNSDSETYYQVMFASLDNILFEIVYIGPKQ